MNDRPAVVVTVLLVLSLLADCGGPDEKRRYFTIMDKKQAPEAVMRYAVFLRKTKPGEKKIFLFGSYAIGTFHEDSDIDLAIVFDNLSDSFDMQVELMKMRRKFDIRIEPHPFSESDFNASNPLVKEILKNGLEIA